MPRKITVNSVLFAKRFFVILSKAYTRPITLSDNKPCFYGALGNYGSIIVKQGSEMNGAPETIGF